MYAPACRVPTMPVDLRARVFSRVCPCVPTLANDRHATAAAHRPRPLLRWAGWPAAARRPVPLVHRAALSRVGDVPVLRHRERERDAHRTRGPAASLHRGGEPSARLPRSAAVRLRRRGAQGGPACDHAPDGERSGAPASRPRGDARHRTALHRRRWDPGAGLRVRTRPGGGRDLMRPVYVTGVGLHPFGRFADHSLTALGVTAVRSALADAGIGRGGFQAAFCGTVYGGVATGHKVLTALGLSGVPTVNVEAGCASGGAALSLAAAQVANGQHDTVLVFGVEKMPRGMIRSSFFEPWREEAGLAATPAYFALRAQRLMLESDVRPADLAAV